MWQVQAADRLEWRASLENPHTGEKFVFAALPLLYQFLMSGGTDLQAVSGITIPRPDQKEEA
jgi:hypothetical protein